MEKINIAELLKDCPKGMELDCSMYDNVTFDYIEQNPESTYPIHCLMKINGGYNALVFTHYGCNDRHPNAKCVIFPKGKTTWEGFQIPFKDGDVVVSKRGDIHLLWTSDSSYCAYREYYNNKLDCTITTGVDVARHATEEEKEKLFKAIKDNGYRWNNKTKTLEKLPEFKAGDVLVSTAGNIVLCSHIDDSQVVHFHCRLNPLGEFEIKNDIGVGKSFHCTLASDTEKQRLFDKLKSAGYKYNPQTNKLEKLIVPKFKVGDKVESIFNKNQYIITELTDAHYVLVEVNNKFRYVESIIEDKNWKLVIEPKFKVGDRVRNKNYKDYIYDIHDIIDKGYRAKEINADSPILILFGSQEDNYELVPNKFDITTLMPFESRVLVRDYNTHIWEPAFLGKLLDKKNPNLRYLTTNGRFKYCIPYENNQHLLGTTNDCDEYFKTWE